jgi:mono/diheme cytochrome c family protein
MRRLILSTALFLGSFSGNLAVAEDLTDYTGPQLYKRFCASCHGPQGLGDGPVAPYFKLQPPDLTRITRRSGGEFPAERIRRIVDGRGPLPPHGSREMPVWGRELAAADGDRGPRGENRVTVLIDRLVDHLKALQLP